MQAEFYVLHTQDLWPKFTEIITKYYNSGVSMYINCEDSAQASFVDDLLWTYDPLSFIPHDRASLNVVVVGANPSVLCNLALTMPENFQNFANIIEFVEDIHKEKRRANYRVYKQQGYAMIMVD
jgi:DNA polymerase III subunit chi